MLTIIAHVINLFVFISLLLLNGSLKEEKSTYFQITFLLFFWFCMQLLVCQRMLDCPHVEIEHEYALFLISVFQYTYTVSIYLVIKISRYFSDFSCAA